MCADAGSSTSSESDRDSDSDSDEGINALSLSDEWEAVVPHLQEKEVRALALTSVQMLLTIGTTMVKSESMDVRVSRCC